MIKMAKKEKGHKTNAVRILEQQKIEYALYTYETEDGKIDGTSVAKKINKDPEDVYKTLVAKSDNHNLYVFCIPVDKELDLKRAAKAIGEKKVLMLPVKDLVSYTGYIRGGCSPVGMKKLYPTFIDISAEQKDKIIVSGGVIGLQIMVKTSDLIRLLNGQYASISL